MLIFKNDSVASVMVGDCLASLATLPDLSINCCVTSPPYYGLRDYGVVGQIGLEESPDSYIARLVDVFREVRRVLRDDGTLWLNIGDSYATGTTASRAQGKRGLGAATQKAQDSVPRIGNPDGCKTKDLIGIPWMLAFALRADGWYLRQDIIWHKPNPMPESVRDRCTKAHEYIFLLSKSDRYYFDSEAMKEPAVGSSGGAPLKARDSAYRPDKAKLTNNGLANGWEPSETRNRRSVWTVATKPYKGAHFATFPPGLIEPCILAGCPSGGNVLDPFGGSGTTGGVALKNGRNAILCELNPEYAALMPDRIGAIL